MNKEIDELMINLLKKLSKLSYIKPGEVPNINLYMDQVTTFMDEHLSDGKRHEDDKILTKTMINNYTKNNLLPAPVKKKYSKNHIYILTFIYYFKNILSIGDIQKLLTPMTERFFDGTNDFDLDEIYKEVYNLEKQQINGLSKDIILKSKIAASAFEGATDESDKDFLQLFSMVSLLSFDVYMKKNIIENLIDEFSETYTANTKPDKKTMKAEKNHTDNNK